MRLTERKVCYPQCDKQGNITKVDYIEIKDKKVAEEKLCRLEDIEEELGIELLTLLKASKEGFWYNSNGTFYFTHCDISLVDKCFRKYIDYFKDYMFFDFKDYGKTWALTKEELL